MIESINDALVNYQILKSRQEELLPESCKSVSMDINESDEIIRAAIASASRRVLAIKRTAMLYLLFMMTP